MEPEEVDRPKGATRRASWPQAGFAWLGLAALALFSRAGAPEPSAGTRGQIYVDDLKLTAGDILFRRGRSLISRAVLAADGHGEYSHVGLVALVADRPWVLHATPPEEPNIAGGVIAEPLAVFLAPDRASAAAVYRPRDRRAARAAERTAWDYVHARLRFDDDFDLVSSERLYCTELVWKAYRAAGVDLEAGIPGLRGRYLLPGRLEESPQLERIGVFQEEVRNR